MPLKTARASSYPPWSGVRRSPPNPGMPRLVVLVAMPCPLYAPAVIAPPLLADPPPDHNEVRRKSRSDRWPMIRTGSGSVPWWSGRRSRPESRPRSDRRARRPTGVPRPARRRRGGRAAGRPRPGLARTRGRPAHRQGRHRAGVAAPHRPLPHLHRHRGPAVAEPRRLPVEGRRPRRPAVHADLRRARGDATDQADPRLPVRHRVAGARRRVEGSAPRRPPRPCRRAGAGHRAAGSIPSTVRTPRASRSRRPVATT